MDNNGWISVKERLPEIDQDVLVAYWTGNRYAIGFATYAYHYEELKFIEPNFKYHGYFEITVDCDFWRPLPEPPEDNL